MKTQLKDTLKDILFLDDANALLKTLNTIDSGWYYSEDYSKIQRSGETLKFLICSKQEIIEDILTFLGYMANHQLQNDALATFEKMFRNKFNLFSLPVYGLKYYLEQLTLEQLHLFVSQYIVTYNNICI